MAANSRLAVALHALTVLGHAGDTLLTSEVLAGSINTNPVVVRRIVSDLAAAGLVESRRGKSGGIRLARPAADITLWEVYVALDGTSPFCLPPKSASTECPLGQQVGGVLTNLFSDLDAAIEDHLRNLRVADLVAQVSV